MSHMSTVDGVAITDITAMAAAAQQSGGALIIDAGSWSTREFGKQSAAHAIRFDGEKDEIGLTRESATQLVKRYAAIAGKRQLAREGVRNARIVEHADGRVQLIAIT
jgi:hypothetical protein